jgi:hypothetical protein
MESLLRQVVCLELVVNRYELTFLVVLGVSLIVTFLGNRSDSQSKVTNSIFHYPHNSEHLPSVPLKIQRILYHRCVCLLNFFIIP